MIAPAGHRLGSVAVAAVFALFATGCYYGPTHRYDDSYAYYRHSHYVPYTDLRIGIFSGSHRYHDGHDGYYWRGVPYSHYGKPHDYRGHDHWRHDGGRRHGHRDGRRH